MKLGVGVVHEDLRLQARVEVKLERGKMGVIAKLISWTHDTEYLTSMLSINTWTLFLLPLVLTDIASDCRG